MLTHFLLDCISALQYFSAITTMCMCCFYILNGQTLSSEREKQQKKSQGDSPKVTNPAAVKKQLKERGLCFYARKKEWEKFSAIVATHKKPTYQLFLTSTFQQESLARHTRKLHLARNFALLLKNSSHILYVFAPHKCAAAEADCNGLYVVKPPDKKRRTTLPFFSHSTLSLLTSLTLIVSSILRTFPTFLVLRTSNHHLRIP